MSDDQTDLLIILTFVLGIVLVYTVAVVFIPSFSQWTMGVQ